MGKMLQLYQFKEKKRFRFQEMNFAKETFPYRLPKIKFGYNALRDIPINPALCCN